MNLVVDASVAVKWFFPEPYVPQARLLLLGESVLHAPSVMPLEFDSVLCKRIRKRELRLEKAELIRLRLQGALIQLHPIEPLMDDAFLLAARTWCTPTDCLYVILAAQLNGKMVTADERLCRGQAGGPFANHILWIGDVR